MVIKTSCKKYFLLATSGSEISPSPKSHIQKSLRLITSTSNNNNQYLNRVTPSVAGLVSTGALYNVK